MKIAHLAVGLLALGALVTGCQQAVSTAKIPAVNRVAAFNFYDAATGAKVNFEKDDKAYYQSIATDGELKEITSNKSDLGQIDITNDQVRLFDFPADTKFVLKVVKTGYKDFEGHATFGGESNPSLDKYGNPIDTEAYALYNSVLLPTSITNLTPAYTITVRDANSKAAVTSGTYVIDLATAPSQSGGTDTAFTQYTTPSVAAAKSPTVGSGYLLTGTVSAGTISVAAGTLFANQSYNVKVIGATGYKDNTLAFTANEVTTADGLALELTPSYTSVDESTTLKLIKASNLDAYGKTKKGERTITLTYNNPVEISNEDVFGERLVNVAAGLLVRVTSDTDNDGNPTTAGTTTAPAVTALPTGLTVVASGSTVVITLTATDADLTTGAGGALDTDDALTWDLDSLFGKAKVRIKDSTGAYTVLSSVTAVDDYAGNSLDYNNIGQIVVR